MNRTKQKIEQKIRKDYEQARIKFALLTGAWLLVRKTQSALIKWPNIKKYKNKKNWWKKMNKKEQLKNQVKKDKELARIKFALITGI